MTRTNDYLARDCWHQKHYPDSVCVDVRLKGSGAHATLGYLKERERLLQDDVDRKDGPELVRAMIELEAIESVIIWMTANLEQE